MIDRWISLVPPAIDSDSVNRASAAHCAPGSICAGLAECRSGPGQGVGADDPPCQVGELSGDEGVGELAERTDRTGIGTRRRGGRQRSRHEQALADLGDVQAHEIVTHHGIGELASPGLVDETVRAVMAHPATLTRGASDALMVQHRRRDAPARPGRRQDRVRRHEHVGEEDLVEVRCAVQLADRADLHARRGEVDDEHREPGVLGRGRIGAGQQEAEVGAVGERRPDLLAVDEPAARHRNRPGLDPGDVGARGGFGEQLAPHLATGEDARHVAASLRIGAELQQRRQAVARA